MEMLAVQRFTDPPPPIEDGPNARILQWIVSMLLHLDRCVDRLNVRQREEDDALLMEAGARAARKKQWQMLISLGGFLESLGVRPAIGTVIAVAAAKAVGWL